MAKPVYFQWQNEILRKTIYPMREPKLRDFLVYFQEIDLWKEYKDKTPDEIPEQVRAYEEAQSRSLVEAAEAYGSLREYFLTEDVSPQYQEKYGQPDSDELIQIKSLHDTVRAYFPKYNDVRKEKYFISQRVAAWKLRRQEVLRRIKSQQRRVDAIQPDHPIRPEEEKKLERLQSVTLAMLDDELAQLDAFEDAIANIETRRLELDKIRKTLLRRKDELTRQLEWLRSRISPLETKTAELNAELARLKNPPDLDALEAYFLSGDVSEVLRAGYPEIDQNLLDTLNAIYKELAQNFSYTNSVEGKAGAARTYYWRVREVQRVLQRDVTKLKTDLRNMPETWSHRAERQAALVNKRDTGLPVVTAELAKLTDFQSALLNTKKSQIEIDSMIESTSKELGSVSLDLSELRGQAIGLKSELDSIEAKLAVPDEKSLVQYTPEKAVTIRDIVNWQAEAYKEGLTGKDQFELLDEIHRRFEREPQRYPVWLQYMVVHFSGMRYASAHGSWADPRDLLARLRAPKIEEDVKALSDEQVAELCKEKIAAYESSNGGSSPRPLLASAHDKRWTQQIGWHLPTLKSFGPQTRRRGLTDLRKVEDAYELNQKPTQEALDMLLAMKGQFPGWAWKQIVKLTQLRLTEVTDLGWEKLTPQEEQESYSRENWPLRSIIDAWANYDATGWREEHGRTHELIVTRAVCNEAAEHIQHMRGHLPPGGLTARPKWYRTNENENSIPGTPRPYYVKATAAEQYTPGASVLWLRFVNKQPDPWQIAKAIETKDKVGLLPPAFIGGQKQGGKNEPGWSYRVGDVITRQRMFASEEKGDKKTKTRSREQQWLRWIHEATVVEVADTAEGTMVITFETALPDDDKGTSSIGIFKKPLRYFLSDGEEESYNRSFVGYVPEGQVPEEHIKALLDWDKILHR